MFNIVADGPEITPDQFDWYFYQGRAIGILVDLNCGSICSGKILLGSYMKKPLWVDHSAATVSTLLTLLLWLCWCHLFVSLSVLLYTGDLEMQYIYLFIFFIVMFFIKVFNLLTSSVSVLINGSKSRFGPGQSFMVPCGKNYISLHIIRFNCILVNCFFSVRELGKYCLPNDHLISCVRLFKAVML